MNKTLEAGLVLVVAFFIIMGVWRSSEIGLVPGFLFPMDDSYIHLVNARNLAEGHGLTFNTNPRDKGVSTSSIGWTLLLAAGERLGCGVETAARWLGILAYILVVWLTWSLASWVFPFKSLEHSKARTTTALLVALSGNLIWFGLSGMETMVFLALALTAIVTYGNRKYPWMCLALAALAVTRVEGVLLIGTIAGATMASALARMICRFPTQSRRGFALAILLAVIPLMIWFGVVHSMTGHWLPTTLGGKQLSQMHAAVQIASGILHQKLPQDASLPWWRMAIYPVAAVLYGAGFVAGAAYLPGPKIPLPKGAETIADGISVLGLLVFVGMIVLILGTVISWIRRWRGYRIAIPLDQSSHPQSRPWLIRWASKVAMLNERQLALLALGLWVVFHGLAYWHILPIPGTASRYQVPNHQLWWLLLGIAAWKLDGRLWRWRVPVATTLLLLAAWNCVYWQGVYASDCRHMHDVRMKTANWTNVNIPKGAVIAIHDIGMMGWRGGHRIADLGGLTDPEFVGYYRSGHVDRWLAKQGAAYCVLPAKHSSEHAGFYDYAAMLGLDARHGIRLVCIAHFENDYLDWRRGAAPTWNALPAVEVYRIEYVPILRTQRPGPRAPASRININNNASYI